MRGIRGVGIGLLALVASASSASAQALTFNAAAEAAGDEVYVAFSELGLAAAGLGLRPVASVGGYMVFTEGDDSWGVVPAVGLRYQTGSGLIQGRVGWAFVKEDAVPFFGGSQGGFHTAFQTEFYGSVYNAQGLASYNWGAEYLWSRARVGRRLGSMGTNGSWGLGAELTWQAQAEETAPGVDGPGTTQIGPVLIFTPRVGGPTYSLGGGWKKSDFGLTDESTWYVRGELYLP